MKLPKYVDDFIDDNLIILSAMGVCVVLLIVLTKKQKSQYDKDCGCGDKISYDDITEEPLKTMSKEKGFACLSRWPKSQADCKPGCKLDMGSSADCSGCPDGGECMCQMGYTPPRCVKDENY